MLQSRGSRLAYFTISKASRGAKVGSPQNKVRWRSWLSHLSNTQKVPGSSPGRTIFYSVAVYQQRKQLLPVLMCCRWCRGLAFAQPLANMFRWLFVCTWFTLSLGSTSLGERALPVLSSSALETLQNMRDPSKNLDPYDPYSHLQKILIPRIRE